MIVSRLVCRRSLTRFTVPGSAAISTARQRYFDNSFPPKNGEARSAVSILKDLGSLRRSPTPALLLGVAGLIPFATVPSVMMVQGHYCPTLAHLHIAYGTVIVSFLGGVRWGMVVEGESIPPTWFQYGWSIIPPIVGWTALFVPAPAGYLALVVGLMVTCYVDLIETGYPSWFRGLRFLLTLIAVLSLWTSLMCRVMLGTKEDQLKKMFEEGQQSAPERRIEE